MRKLAVFIILLSLIITPAVIVCADQYQGGSGQGYASAEYTGRLDGGDKQQQVRQGKEGAQYHGGPGAGYASAEYTGRIDGGNKQLQDRQGKAGAQYSGGKGGGYAMAEYTGCLDNIKKKPKSSRVIVK